MSTEVPIDPQEQVQIHNIKIAALTLKIDQLQNEIESLKVDARELDLRTADSGFLSKNFWRRAVTVWAHNTTISFLLGVVVTSVFAMIR
jgi:hypothetical protein